jgi:hypothetical protein
MPAIVDPYGARPYAAPVDTIGDLASGSHATSLRARVGAALRRADLTRALAAGADPGASDELALRARQLTSERNRRTLARTLRRTLAEAQRPPMTRGRAVIIDRAAVLHAKDSIAEMIERLESANPVRAQGVALLEQILTNADRSPLYNRSESGALRRVIRVATAALDAAGDSHEFELIV